MKPVLDEMMEENKVSPNQRLMQTLRHFLFGLATFILFIFITFVQVSDFLYFFYSKISGGFNRKSSSHFSSVQTTKFTRHV